jgi:cation transport ATPase
VVLVALAITGHISLPAGVVGHEGSTIVVITNGLRLLRGRRPTPYTPRLPDHPDQDK